MNMKVSDASIQRVLNGTTLADKRLRDAGRQGSKAWTEELNRQVGLAKAEMAEEQRLAEMPVPKLNMKKFLLAQAVKLGCRQMGLEHMRVERVIGE